MIFVPLSKVPLGSLSESGNGNASGIFNFQETSATVSVSPSLGLLLNVIFRRTATILSTATAVRAGFCADNFRVSLHSYLITLVPGPRNTLLRAYSLTNTALNNQAQLYAYVDVFQYFAILCAVCVPLAFLFKKPSRVLRERHSRASIERLRGPDGERHPS